MGEGRIKDRTFPVSLPLPHATRAPATTATPLQPRETSSLDVESPSSYLCADLAGLLLRGQSEKELPDNAAPAATLRRAPSTTEGEQRTTQSTQEEEPQARSKHRGASMFSTRAAANSGGFAATRVFELHACARGQMSALRVLGVVKGPRAKLETSGPPNKTTPANRSWIQTTPESFLNPLDQAELQTVRQERGQTLSTARHDEQLKGNTKCPLRKKLSRNARLSMLADT